MTRPDRLTEAHDRLVAAIEHLVNGEEWQRFLDTARRFRSYSLNNLLLIFAQRPDATQAPGDQPRCADGGRRAARFQELNHLFSPPSDTSSVRDSDREAGLIDHPPRGRATDPTVKLDVTDVPVLGRSQVDDRIVLTGAHAEEMRFHAG